MSDVAVVYKSRYGNARQYAKWIAAALEADLFELGKNTRAALGGYKTIIYGAGLYAGGIDGIKEFREIFRERRNASFILFTVGIASAASPESFVTILDKNFTPEMFAKIKTFHLRGGIDYKKLSVPHRAMMLVMMRILKRKKPAELDEDDRTLMSSYGKSVSFLDESSIEPVLSYVCSPEQ